MKKVIFIGSTGAGKTSLIQKLTSQDIQYKKTQSVDYIGEMIDTPGEYLENPRFYNALVTLSFESKKIIFVHDSTAERSLFPPQFAKLFNQKAIGVVTKIDHKNSCKERSVQFLKDAGIQEIFELSAYTNEGISDLVKAL